jgi:hypothetical protein
MTYWIIFAVVAAMALLWQGSRWLRRKRIERRLRNAMGGSVPGKLSVGGRRTSPAGNNVSPQVQGKLLRLLGNHQPTVDRLVDQARWKNPGESEQWYWEKVLYDLERDRWR